MNSVNYLEILRFAAPETIVTVTMLLVLGADLTFLRARSVADRFYFGAFLSAVGCAAAAYMALVVQGPKDLFDGILVADPQTNFVKVAILALSVLTICISTAGKFTDHVGEYLSLILLGTIGLMFLVSARDLLMIYLSLELASLVLYILTAFNKHNVRSSEAALKYFLFGSMSAAFLLFGFSLLYGLSGSTNLAAIAQGLAGKGLDPLLLVALVMTVAGFGFKVAAVPFHLWAPDAYEGAPTPSAAFIGAGSKVASFYILAQVLSVAFAGAEGSAVAHHFVQGWIPVVAVVAAFSMVLGNLTAIAQNSVKRLLAYSAIAHAGYMLLGVISGQMGQSALMFYVITYGLTTIGAFGVVMMVEEATGSDAMANFAGLSRRAPMLSLCLLVFFLSLGGIPPLAGFIGKFFLFSAAVMAEEQHLGLLWLVILAIAMSAVSFYYYLRVLKQVYVQDAPEGAADLQVPVLTQLTLVALAASVIYFGCAPSSLTQFFGN